MTNERIHSGVYNCPNCGAAATPESVRCAYCHSGLATHVCSKCYGAIFIGMNRCPWCGETAAGGKPIEGARGKCPRCDIDFLLVKASRNILSECPGCGGLWVDNDTFQAICADKEQQQAIIEFNPELSMPVGGGAAQQGRAYIPCPVCQKLMNRRQFAGCSGVIVDWCKPHGAWFDRNELKQIVQFIQNGGLKKAREKEKFAIEEERMKLRDERRTIENRRALDLAASQDSRDSDVLGFLGGIWNALE